MKPDRAWVRLSSGRRLNLIDLQEGAIVDGERNENGEWLLDEQFTVFTTDEDFVRVSGWGCYVAVQ